MIKNMTVTIPIGEKYRKEWKELGITLGKTCEAIFRAEYVSTTMLAHTMKVKIKVHTSHEALVKKQIRKALKDQNIVNAKFEVE